MSIRTGRRSFMKAAAIGSAAAAAGSLAAPAIAQNKRELKLVTTWPKNFPGLGTAAERFAKRVTEATDGALTVRVYAAGELVGAFDAFDAVSSGNADMYHGADYYWQGKSAAFNFFAAVPFGLTANEMTAWIYHGGGQELWDELSARFNVKPLMCGNSGVQMGGWFNKEINTLEDLRGLKIRMPGLGGEVMRRLGATAVSMPGGEIFQALQSGNIDATEWVGPWNDLAFGFYKVTKHYYWPGFHEPGSALALGTNLSVWNELTRSQRQVIKAVAGAVNDTTLAEFNARNGASLSTLVNKHGVKLRRFSNDILREMGRISGIVVREAGESDDISKKVYESFLASRRDGIKWSRISEEAYWEARRLPFDYDESAPASASSSE